MPTRSTHFPLPDRILPEDFRGHDAEYLDAAAQASWRLVERGHFDAARFLAHVWEQPRRYGFSSAIDYAEAKLHIRGRQAYMLIQAYRETSHLRKLRKAWEDGRVSFCNLREVAKVATPEDEAHWTDLAARLPYRALYAKVHGKPDAEAAAGERPWPDTKLSGEIGRPDRHQQVARPMTTALAELERRVFEKHNRAAGQDTAWCEFLEAALVLYEAELDRMEREVPEDIRRILARARYRCLVPHCSRRAQLELHHGQHRSQLGSSEAWNLAVVCSRHHRAHHEGLLEMTGDGVRGFRLRHRDRPGGRWLEFPEGGDAPYDPLERAWDGPTYVRETPDHIYGGARPARVIKNRRTLRRGLPIERSTGPHPRLE